MLPTTAVHIARASELRHTATVKLVQQARGSIVNIHGQKTLGPNDEGYRQGEASQNVNGMGTGIIIDERGYILTNYHVVDGVKKIQVTFSDERTQIATLVANDNKTDLAVIKIDASQKLPVITVGISSDLMIGEPVVAVGNAYGYEHTVTRGIISALHRTVQVSDTQRYSDLIQTDAS
ncbi:MAG TPA: trypsin-like peptidase domain-containing protein, partial [Pirellulales bacterium]|nr:trypsin-like peptidase domain-containing protein [Pirellulales bacterium]